MTRGSAVHHEMPKRRREVRASPGPKQAVFTVSGWAA